MAKDIITYSRQGKDRVDRAVHKIERLKIPKGKHRRGQTLNPLLLLKGKADAEIEAGGSGYFTVWNTTADVETETGEVVFAYDWLATGFNADDRAVLLFIDGDAPQWYCIKSSDSAVEVRKGKSDGTISAGGSGTFSIWEPVSGTETDTTENLEDVRDWLQTGFSTGDEAYLFRIVGAEGSEWYASKAGTGTAATVAYYYRRSGGLSGSSGTIGALTESDTTAGTSTDSGVSIEMDELNCDGSEPTISGLYLLNYTCSFSVGEFFPATVRFVTVGAKFTVDSVTVPGTTHGTDVVIHTDDASSVFYASLSMSALVHVPSGDKVAVMLLEPTNDDGATTADVSQESFSMHLIAAD